MTEQRFRQNLAKGHPSRRLAGSSAKTAPPFPKKFVNISPARNQALWAGLSMTVCSM